MNRLGRLALLLVMFLVGPVWADPVKKSDPEPQRYETRKEHDRDGIGKFYMGREIAQVMGHQAASAGSSGRSARRRNSRQTASNRSSSSRAWSSPTSAPAAAITPSA